MKKVFRSILSLLLCVVLLGTMLPAGSAAQPALDYSGADKIFAGLYATILGKKAVMNDETRADAVERYLENAEGVVPGSVRRTGNDLTWQTPEGISCRFSPYLYARMTGCQSASSAPVELPEEAAIKAATASARDVYLFGPYYGLDETFDFKAGSYDTWGKALAHCTGGSFDRYTQSRATIDALAAAIEDAAVVLIDSHGETDSDWRTSYICLQTDRGITQDDYAYDEAAGVCHAYYGGRNGRAGFYEVDGTAISNHMEKDAPGNLLWCGICFGMATEGICKPMLDRGVGVVYGYSQEVTVGADDCWFGTAMEVLSDGGSMSDAVAAAKDTWGAWDYSPTISAFYDWPSEWTSHTLREAIDARSAFPVVASNLDAFPQDPDTLQTVKSDWILPRLEVTVALELPDGVKCRDLHGYLYDDGRLPTPLGTPRNQEHAYSFVGWSPVEVPLQTSPPTPIYGPGEEFRIGYPDDDDPLNFREDSVLYGVYSYLEGEETFYTTQVPDGEFDPFDPSALFDDMPFGTWYYDSVRYGLAQALVNGYTDGTFRPGNTIRRSEVVSILYRAAGSPTSFDEKIFADVEPTSWYGSAVAWAAQNGIVLGYDDGSFRPDQPVTRAQLAVFFYRYACASSEDTSAIVPFPDQEKAPDWARKELSWAVTAGLVNGNSVDGKSYLQPLHTATRAQFVTILQRYLTSDTIDKTR